MARECYEMSFYVQPFRQINLLIIINKINKYSLLQNCLHCLFGL